MLPQKSLSSPEPLNIYDISFEIEISSAFGFVIISKVFTAVSYHQPHLPRNVVQYVTIHHKTSVKSPQGHFQIMLYLKSTCPKL